MNQAKASLYAQLMNAGKMRPVDIDVVVSPTGIKYLMNGQHVCSGIILSNKPYDGRVQYWKCDDENDLWHLFGSFDVHAARTEQQILKAARPFLGSLSTLPLRILQACSSALTMVSTSPPNFTSMQIMKTQKTDLLNSNEDMVLWIGELCEAAGQERLPVMRTSAVASMIVTRRLNPEKADIFWKKVCSGEMCKKEDPEYRLGNILLNGSTQRFVLGGGQRNRHFYCVCIAYWNSWMRGEKRMSVKSMKNIPVALSK